MYVVHLSIPIWWFTFKLEIDCIGFKFPKMSLATK